MEEWQARRHASVFLEQLAREQVDGGSSTHTPPRTHEELTAELIERMRTRFGAPRHAPFIRYLGRARINIGRLHNMRSLCFATCARSASQHGLGLLHNMGSVCFAAWARSA